MLLLRPRLPDVDVGPTKGLKLWIRRARPAGLRIPGSADRTIARDETGEPIAYHLEELATVAEYGRLDLADEVEEARVSRPLHSFRRYDGRGICSSRDGRFTRLHTRLLRSSPIMGDSVARSATTRLGSALALVLALTGGTANASMRSACPPSTPAWARPLGGVRPYSVEHDYGTSHGLTCDMRVYTTNRAALDGKARFRAGDTTATVCVVRRVGR
jgi:hypothetical protein